MDYPEILDENYYKKLLNKKEFRDNKSTNKISKFKKLEPQQILLRNYISPATPYNGVLIFHETGVGKTGAAISIAERFKEFLPTKILILVKNDTIAKNFKNELTKKIFTGDEYTNDDDRKILENGTAQEKIDIQKNISRKINRQYEFITYGTFINRTIGKRKSKRLDQNVREKGRQLQGEPIPDLNNRLIIIDEVHNISGNDGYLAVRTMLNKSINTKVVLLSATPAFDNVREIVEVMNLILPKDKQLPDRLNKKNGDSLFKTTRLFDKKKAKLSEINSPITIPVLTEKGEEIIKSHAKGIISYLKSNLKTFPTQVQKGVPLMNQKGSLKVIKCKMSQYQWQTVQLALQRDKGEESPTNETNTIIKSSVAFKNTSDATTFASPEKDSEGFGKYGKNVLNYLPNNLKSELSGESLKKYSAKLYKLIKNLEKRKGTAFVFSGFVEGGVVLISQILRLNGFSPYGSSDTKPKFAVLSGQTEAPQRERIRKIFNKKENKKGKHIAVLLATPVFSEGITLKNVRQVHILEPSWNMSRLIQVDGRCIRNNSHADLKPEDRIVNTYKYCAVAPTENLPDTIDEIKYKVSEKKDRSIKKMERILKKSAFDCALNKERNRLHDSFNFTAKCDYTNCNYHCDSGNLPNSDNIDYSTFPFSVTKRDISDAKIIIKKLFKLSPFWSFYQISQKLELLANISTDITAIALHEIIDKNETFTDLYNRDGYLIYRGKYYIFQPDFLDENASIYSRTKFPENKPSLNLKKYLLLDSPDPSSITNSNSNSKSNKSKHISIEQLDNDKVQKVIKNKIYMTSFNRSGTYDGEYRIVDNRKLSSNEDKRKVLSGQNITSISVKKLADIIGYLNNNDPKDILTNINNRLKNEKVPKPEMNDNVINYFKYYKIILAPSLI